MNRYVGLLIAAVAVGAGFVVMIGTGYRVTHDPSGPISDGFYFASIFALFAVIAFALFRVFKNRQRPARRSNEWKLTELETMAMQSTNEKLKPEQNKFWSESTASTPMDKFTPLRGRVDALNEIIKAPTDAIPTYGVSMQNGLAHIEIDGDTYHFVREERGKEFERTTTMSIDELLYLIFRDVTWSKASILAHETRRPLEDFRRELFRQQHALLDRLNHEWMLRNVAEHEEILREHPFVDTNR